MSSIRATKLDYAAAFTIGALIALLITAPIANAHSVQPHANAEFRNNDTSSAVISVTTSSHPFPDALQ